MIDVYSWFTPNGQKVHIMLQEIGLSYKIHAVNIQKNEQFKPEFLAIAPNNKIPAIVDSDGPDGKPLTLFESGAILLYLAGKTGKLLGNNNHDRYQVLQWVMFQMAGFGPMLGQANHFINVAPEKIDYAINRFTTEAERLYSVLDKQLAKHSYVAGDFYSIADIAIYPWVHAWKRQGIQLANYPHISQWYETVGARDGVRMGMTVLAK